MREEQLLSVGIDIGTSTTQCVFSCLTLSNTASSFSVPRIRVTEKKILYRAPVQLTPLLDRDTIDAPALESMIRGAYVAAGIDPAEIRLGAVMITGETARKANARAVTSALSELAGDFVVATAGAALESILAGRGAGAVAASRFFTAERVLRPEETSHATVIGAGAYSMTVSGSTIQYRSMKLPIKSLPVASVPFAREEDLPGLGAAIRRQYEIFDGECAIYMEGIPGISWACLKQAAETMAEAMREHALKVLIFREDMAKAFGQALSRCWTPDTPFLCLDGIELMYGDMLDIGGRCTAGAWFRSLSKPLRSHSSQGGKACA